ncbi:MAG: ARMT1-like domain-containing protein [Candidatus Saccharicenans sp.]
MKAASECYLCLLSQVLRTAGVCGLEESKAAELMRAACGFLAQTDFDRTPPEISEDLYRLIASLTGYSDPYEKLKITHIGRALELYPRLKTQVESAADPIRRALELSLAGNVIDFGANSCADCFGEEDFLKASSLAIDHYDLLRKDLDKAEKILILGDNAGETVFDRLFIEAIGKPVIYAVREKPIINDATLKEARLSMLGEVAEIISSGSTAPGTVLEKSSPEFQKLLKEADLIISKGQGNFECLEQVPGPFYFLLKAKCQVVSRYLQVPQGSLILMRSRNYREKVSL